EGAAPRRVEILGEGALKRRDRQIDREVAHLGERFRFGQGDLLDREVLAPLDRGVEVARALRGRAFGLGLGLRDDRLGLFQGIALLSLIIGERRLRFLAQPLRLVELGLDLRRARIERAGDDGSGLVDEISDRDEEGDEDPEFGFHHKLGHQPRSRIAWSTAAAARAASSSAPVSFWAAARVTSIATSRSEPSASRLAASMRRSAAAVSCASSSAILRCRSAARALSCSEVSRSVICACIRASASALSQAAITASASRFICAALSRSPSMRARRAAMIPPTRG